MNNLSGQVAVVTGGASGIGFALAERFAAEGDTARRQVLTAILQAGTAASEVAGKTRGVPGTDARVAPPAEAR